MSDTEKEEEEELGDEKEEESAASKPPSEVQIKLAEQGTYVAGKLDLIFSLLRELEGELRKVHKALEADDEAIKKEFDDKLTFLSNRVLTIEKERAGEKAAAEAARRAALGLPPEEVDPFEKFNKLHADLAGLVRSNPTKLDNAVVKLEETLYMLGDALPSTGNDALAEAPPSTNDDSPVEEVVA